MRALLGLFLLLCSAWAGAQTRTINVMYVYSPGAVNFLTSLQRNVDSNAAALTVQANQIYGNTDVQFNNVAAIDGSAWCCGANHLWSVPETSTNSEVVGAVRWAQRDLRTAIYRDFYKADIVVVVGDYERGLTPEAPNDVPGVSLPQCSLDGGAVPGNGYIGINIALQVYGSQPILAHELGHQLCTTHDGWYKKTGSTPQDCEVRWSIEYADFDKTYPSFSVPANRYTYQQGVQQNYTSAQAACNAYWVDQQRRINGHFNPFGTLVQNGTTLNCNGTFDTGQYAGTGTIYSYAGTYSGGPFVCENAVQVPYFAGAGTPPGQYGGTTVRNSIAAMNAQAAATSAFRNTRLAPALLARIVKAAVVQMFTLP